MYLKPKLRTGTTALHDPGAVSACDPVIQEISWDPLHFLAALNLRRGVVIVRRGVLFVSTPLHAD